MGDELPGSYSGERLFFDIDAERGGGVNREGNYSRGGGVSRKYGIYQVEKKDDH